MDNNIHTGSRNVPVLTPPRVTPALCSVIYAEKNKSRPEERQEDRRMTEGKGTEGIGQNDASGGSFGPDELSGSFQSCNKRQRSQHLH